MSPLTGDEVGAIPNPLRGLPSSHSHSQHTPRKGKIALHPQTARHGTSELPAVVVDDTSDRHSPGQPRLTTKEASGHLTMAKTLSIASSDSHRHSDAKKKAAENEKNQRGLMNRQVISLDRSSVIYSSMALEAAAMPRILSSSSSRRRPPGRARSETPRHPKIPGAGEDVLSGEAATAASRPRSTPMRSARTRRQGDAPAWTLRYAMLLGMGVGEDPDASMLMDGVSSHTPGASGGHHHLLQPNLERTPSKNVGNSVFLTESGWDKRITPKCKMNAEKALKDTRLTMRRHAIVAYGQKRLQLVTAVRSMSMWHPRHMRTLNRVNDLDSPATLKGKVMHVGEGESLPYWQVQQYADDTGLDCETVGQYWTAFHRYDIDEGGVLDSDRAREALADIGLEARNRDEKQELAEIIKDCDVSGNGHLAFFEFLVMQKEVRGRMKVLRRKLVTELFANGMVELQDKVDLEDLELHVRGYAELAPHTEEESATFMEIASSFDSDGDGKVTLTEFQEMAEAIREKFAIMRREEERRIEKEYGIAPLLFQEVRSDLRMYCEVFKRYDHDETHILPTGSFQLFFMDIGLLSPKPAGGFDFKDSALKSMLATARADYPGGLCFAHVLELILTARSQCKLLSQDQLRMKFIACDRDRSGDVTMKEMYTCLEELDMLPHSREEQLAIHRVLEDLDYEGSGSFQFPDFQDFFQRLVEQNQQAERERLRNSAQSLGFSDAQLQALLQAFYRMEQDDKGRLSRLAVAQYITKLNRDPIPSLPLLDEPRMRAYQRQAHKTPHVPVDLHMFLRTIRYIAADPEYEQALIGFMEGMTDAARYPHDSGTKSRLQSERTGFDSEAGARPRRGSAHRVSAHIPQESETPAA
mmetsp:Transcript_13400/g.31464  ORF Transcript_13400/g.31464 Transcript_13400/m.31464 type:complete len:869 (+) Transcript_13400:87-2693(+)